MAKKGFDLSRTRPLQGTNKINKTDRQIGGKTMAKETNTGRYRRSPLIVRDAFLMLVAAGTFVLLIGCAKSWLA
jgi:hypothetical protein